MVVRNPFKQQNGKNWYKNLKEKKMFYSRETFKDELHVWEYLT